MTTAPRRPSLTAGSAGAPGPQSGFIEPRTMASSSAVAADSAPEDLFDYNDSDVQEALARLQETLQDLGHSEDYIDQRIDALALLHGYSVGGQSILNSQLEVPELLDFYKEDLEQQAELLPEDIEARCRLAEDALRQLRASELAAAALEGAGSGNSERARFFGKNAPEWSALQDKTPEQVEQLKLQVISDAKELPEIDIKSKDAIALAKHRLHFQRWSECNRVLYPKRKTFSQSKYFSDIDRRELSSHEKTIWNVIGSDCEAMERAKDEFDTLVRSLPDSQVYGIASPNIKIEKKNELAGCYNVLNKLYREFNFLSTNAGPVPADLPLRKFLELTNNTGFSQRQMQTLKNDTDMQTKKPKGKTFGIQVSQDVHERAFELCRQAMQDGDRQGFESARNLIQQNITPSGDLSVEHRKAISTEAQRRLDRYRKILRENPDAPPPLLGRQAAQTHRVAAVSSSGIKTRNERLTSLNFEYFPEYKRQRLEVGEKPRSERWFVGVRREEALKTHALTEALIKVQPDFKIGDDVPATSRKSIADTVDHELWKGTAAQREASIDRMLGPAYRDKLEVYLNELRGQVPASLREPLDTLSAALQDEGRSEAYIEDRRAALIELHHLLEKSGDNEYGLLHENVDGLLAIFREHLQSEAGPSDDIEARLRLTAEALRQLRRS